MLFESGAVLSNDLLLAAWNDALVAGSDVAAGLL
jgi:hypothetical protein